jgi:hypothetical protein
MDKDVWECDRCHKTVCGSEIKQIKYVTGFMESRHSVRI